MLTGTELRTTYVTYDEAEKTEVISGARMYPPAVPRQHLRAKISCSSADTRESAVCSRLSGRKKRLKLIIEASMGPQA